MKQGVGGGEDHRLGAAGRPARRCSDGGPRLLVGTIGPKTLRHAAAWADGLAGITLDLDVAKQNELFDVGRAPPGPQAGKPHTASGDLVLVRARRRRRRPRPDPPPPAPLHELDPAGVSSTPWRPPPAGPAPRTNSPTSCALRRHRHQRDPSDPDQFRPRPVAPGGRRGGRLRAGRESHMTSPSANYQLEIYFQGLTGVQPTLPMSFDELEARAAQALSPSIWSYVAGGAGDELTQRINATAFNQLGPDPADAGRRHRARPVASNCGAGAGPRRCSWRPSG